MMQMKWAQRLAGVGVAVTASLAASQSRAGCADGAGLCELEGGVYEIRLPDAVPDFEPDGQSAQGAVVFLHGFGGSGSDILKNTALVEALHARGYAVVAPTGLAQRGTRRSWTHLGPGPLRDDVVFLRALRDDLAERFGIAGEDVVLAGFSSGAFMVNRMACVAPDVFGAYAPVAGGFWRPQPEACVGPVRLYHSHGWLDPVVPLEGRPLGGGRFLQGDIFAGLELWRVTNGCADHAPDALWQVQVETTAEPLPLWLRGWSCAVENDLVLELFPGGHQIPRGWADRVITWFEEDGQPLTGEAPKG